MLKRFEVTGFKNFQDTLTLDFTDVKDYPFNGQCVRDGFLKNMIVYGKNATGKTNLGLALFDLVSHLTTNNVSPGLYQYYASSKNLSDVVKFRYVFAFDTGTVDYYYEKNAKRDLLYEKVMLEDELLFSCDYRIRRMNIAGLRQLMPTLNLAFQGQDSLLRYAVTNSMLERSHPLYQMMEYVSHMLWFRSLDENRYIGYKSTSEDYFDFILQPGMKEELEGFLHRAGIEEGLIIRTDVDGQERLYFDTPTPLPFFRVASSGTKALYTFFYWMKTAQHISLLFVDEFDAFYHYELSETIVRMLEEKPGTQTILTSHNTNLLTNRIMRPDCYFILANGQLTSFANATQRELREGHNLEKLYMSGEFDGANH